MILYLFDESHAEKDREESGENDVVLVIVSKIRPEPCRRATMVSAGSSELHARSARLDQRGCGMMGAHQ